MTISEFKIYHKNNPKVWEKLEKYTLNYIEMQLDKQIPIDGIKTSVWKLLNIIRWDESMDRNKYGTFRINNNFFSFYARKFNKKYPKYNTVFNTRKRKIKVK